MSNKSIADFIKPTIITAQQYGTKVSVELNHSDTDIDEVMDVFHTLIVGLGYHDSAWKQWIVDRADEYKEEEIEQAIEDGTYEPSSELRRAAEEYVNMLSERDSKIFFNEIKNPSEPTEAAKKAVEKYVRGLSEKDIDEALAEHNIDEDADWDVTLNDGLENDGWTDELEKQYWEEQCPEPFATPEELNEFDDYGQRKIKKDKPKGRKFKKK